MKHPLTISPASHSVSVGIVPRKEETMKQATISTTRVLATARKALRYVVEHAETDGRAGGCFGMFPKGRFGKIGPPAIFRLIGRVAPGKHGLAKRRAREKPRRLSRHPEHFSSFQSRNERRDWWGGAIATHTCYLSFSGLPELCDEALVLIVARLLGLLTNKQARRIASISKNKLFISWADSYRV